MRSESGEQNKDVAGRKGVWNAQEGGAGHEVVETGSPRQCQVPNTFNRDIIESNNNIYIVTDLCTEGTLRNLLIRNNNYLSESLSLRIIYSLLQGMHELFNHKICHRDLKPENIFIFKDNYKIGDFKNCYFYENQ